MAVNLSIPGNTFSMLMLGSFSVDEKLLTRYMNWSTNFRVLSVNQEMAPSCFEHMYSV